MDLFGGDEASNKIPEVQKAPTISEQIEILLPPLPDETKSDKKAKGRKRFDEQTSRRSSRSADSSKFENVDGSSTVKIGEGGAALDGNGQVVDADAQFASDGKGRLRKSSGVVRVNLPESLSDSSEVVSLGVPGAKIGFSIRRNGVGAGTTGVMLPGQSAATTSQASSTSLVAQPTVSAAMVSSSTTPGASLLPQVASLTGSSTTSTTVPLVTSSTTSTIPASTNSTSATTPSTLAASTTRKLAAPILAENKNGRVTYKGAFGPGADLRYVSNERGIKEEIVLAAAPADGEAVYRFPLSLDGFTARVNAIGTISFLDTKGVEKWVVPLASAWEEPASGAKPFVFSKVAISLEKNLDGGQDLVVRPDEAWLRDPLRKYPVVVDPTITPGANAYGNAAAFVDSYNSTISLGGCGTSDFVCSGPVPPNSASTQKAYVRYDTTGITGSVINSSFLRVNVDNCTSYPTYLSIKAQVVHLIQPQLCGTLGPHRKPEP
jgi:hypothetical protein